MVMAKLSGPDQAGCWVVAAAACVITALLSGMGRGTAIFYISLIEVYGVTRLQANVPFSLRSVLMHLAGPLVGMLGQKFRVRDVTVVGGIFATVGISLCCVAPDVVYISVFWGVFHGLGVALANTLFQVTVNQYFLKYRATAAGIALSGSCVGSFFFPVMLEYFVDTYGLDGAFLLTSGLVIHVIPAALLLTEPPWLKKPKPKHKEKSEVKKKSSVDNRTRPNNCSSQPQNQLICVSLEPKHRTSRSSSNLAIQHHPHIPKVSETHENGIVVSETSVFPSEPIASKSASTLKNGAVNGGYQSSMIDVKADSFNEKLLEGVLTARDARTVSMSELSAIIPMDMHRRSNKVEGSMVGSLLQLCRNPMFYMISFSLATFGLLFDPLMTVIMDYINDKGMDERVGKYLISVLSVGDLIGRMCFGWVTDKEFMTVGHFMVMSQLLQGVAFVLFPLFYTFDVLMGLVVVYGIAAGTEIVMFPILVAKYLPNEQALAIGCTGFFGGLVAFAAPPLIGHFRDNAGSYDGMFYITGSLEIVSAFVWFLEPCFSKLKKAKSSSLLEGSSLRR